MVAGTVLFAVVLDLDHVCTRSRPFWKKMPKTSKMVKRDCFEILNMMSSRLVSVLKSDSDSKNAGVSLIYNR